MNWELGRREPNYRKRAGRSGEVLSHLLGGPSVSSACGNTQVTVLIAAKIALGDSVC